MLLNVDGIAAMTADLLRNVARSLGILNLEHKVMTTHGEAPLHTAAVGRRGDQAAHDTDDAENAGADRVRIIRAVTRRVVRGLDCSAGDREKRSIDAHD